MKYLLLFCTIVFHISCSQGKKSQITYDVGQIHTPMGEMLFTLSDLTPNHSQFHKTRQ